MDQDELTFRSELPVGSLKDLFLLDNWAGSIALVVGGMIISFFLFGFWWPYWQIGDADLFMVYNSFLINDGLPQEFFDHPGYLTILLLCAWFRVLHDFGMLHVYSLSSLLSADDPNYAWTTAVRAGRILSLSISIVFVLGFTALLRRLVADWRVVALGAFALAFSGGVVTQDRIIRTELISGSLLTLAILIALIAASKPRLSCRPALLGVAASFATLALVNKVQSIFLICAIPLIVMPFGRGDDADGFWRTSRLAYLVAGAAVIGAVALWVPAASLVRFGLTEASTSMFPWRPALLAYGTYQPFLVAWIVASVVGFAWWWRVSATETIATLAAMAAATALALLSLEIRYQPQNVLDVINPLEQLSVFTTDLANHGYLSGTAMLRLLFRGVATLVATRTFVLSSSARPTIFLEWFVVAAAILAWRHGQHRLVGQVAALMGTVWAFDFLGTFRGLQSGYFIYADPLVVVAACLLLAGYPALQTHPRAYQIGVALILAHIVVGQSLPVQHTLQGDKPLNLCVKHFGYTKRIDLLPFCPAEST